MQPSVQAKVLEQKSTRKKSDRLQQLLTELTLLFIWLLGSFCIHAWICLCLCLCLPELGAGPEERRKVSSEGARLSRGQPMQS
mmetsp:Transcript_55686/g.104681  ORF Transcript_55686/g.104681 Transcript_55686/m.104681 type:complete len:83 (+) Transcript_55686:372-620(+)